MWVDLCWMNINIVHGSILPPVGTSLNEEMYYVQIGMYVVLTLSICLIFANMFLIEKAP